VQNRFTDVLARVSLEIEHGARRYVFVRSGGDKEPRLEMHSDGKSVSHADNELAELFGHPSASSLKTAVLTWGLLRQDAVRVALDATGGALHQRLAGIVGLEAVSTFTGSARAATQGLLTQRTAQRKSTGALRARWEEATSRSRSATKELATPKTADKALHQSLAAAASRLSNDFVFDTPDAFALAGARELVAGIDSVVKTLHRLTRERIALEKLIAEGGDNVEQAEAGLAIARGQLESVSRRGPAATRLATAALEMLDGDTCPVCGQTVNESDLRAHLKEVAARSGQVIASAQRASDALAQTTSELSRARELSRSRQYCEGAVARAADAVRTALNAVAGLRPVSPIPTDSRETAALTDRLELFAEEVRAASQTASQASGAHLQRLIGEADALGVELKSAERELEEIERRYESAKRLERAAHAATRAIVSDALDELQPSFAEVFDRLNPNPAFTELRARQDVLRNVNQVIPVVRDPQRGIEANPQIVFSEGQLNVVALSYFLGMALNAGDLTLPFLVLDDPLQALDTIAVLGFGDLCRRIRDQCQLIVTTHDRRFSDILVRKLSPREGGGYDDNP
jgi:VIT1/CCC1 family predicted Fe2+/Mn2+ transporter